MCRIWLDKVPAKQQPAPTDCPTAVRNRPSNGKVIFGDDYKDGKTEKGEKREPPFITQVRRGPQEAVAAPRAAHVSRPARRACAT